MNEGRNPRVANVVAWKTICQPRLLGNEKKGDPAVSLTSVNPSKRGYLQCPPPQMAPSVPQMAPWPPQMAPRSPQIAPRRPRKCANIPELFELAVAIAAPWVGAAIADWQSASASTRTTSTFAMLFIAILPAPLTACSLPHPSADP